MVEQIVTVIDELDVPVKDEFIGDLVGSLSLGSANRIQFKGTDLLVHELVNIEDLNARINLTFSNTIFNI